MSAHQNSSSTLKEKFQSLFKPAQPHQTHAQISASSSLNLQPDHPARLLPPNLISPAAVNSSINENSLNATALGTVTQPITKDNVQPLVIPDSTWVNLVRELPAETRIRTLRNLRQQLILPPELTPGKNSPQFLQHASGVPVKIPKDTDIDALWAHCCDILLLPSSSHHLPTSAGNDAGLLRESGAAGKSVSVIDGSVAAQLLQHEAKVAFLTLINAMLLLSKTYQHHLVPTAPSLVANKPLKRMVVNGLQHAIETNDLGRSGTSRSTDSEYLSMALETLSIVTDGGKHIEHVESVLPHFLLRWLLRYRPTSLTATAVASTTNEFHRNASHSVPVAGEQVENQTFGDGEAEDLARSLPPVPEHINTILTLLSNMIHYQNAVIEESIVERSVDYVSRQLLLVTRKTSAIEAGIRLIDAVVCFAFLPAKFEHVVLFLCKTVNIAVEEVASQSWKTMRNILSTALGLRAVQCLCDLLENQQVVMPLDSAVLPSSVSSGADNKDAVRGAIYFIGMALWGSKRVATLQITASDVLPSIAAVLENQNDLVLHYEVLLCLHRFLKKHGSELDLFAYGQIVRMLQKLVDSYYAAVAVSVGAEPVTPDVAATRRTTTPSTSTLALANEPHRVLLNPFKHELGQILTTLSRIYADKHRQNPTLATSPAVSSREERDIDAELLRTFENAIDLLDPEQVAAVVIAERITFDNFVDVDEFLVEDRSLNAELKNAVSSAASRTDVAPQLAQSRRSLFSHCTYRCLRDEREQVQLELLKNLETVFQKLVLVGTEQQIAYFIDLCIMPNFQNVAFVTPSSSASGVSHHAQSSAAPITPSAVVGTRKIKFLSQIADNQKSANFTKIADLLLINLANCVAVTQPQSHPPQAGVSNHLAHASHLPTSSLTSPASLPYLNGLTGSGGTSPALTSTTPLSAFLLPPVGALSTITTKSLYDPCVMLLPDELLRLFARKIFGDQAFEANYVYERLMALLASMYAKNQLHGKLNSMCRRKIFRGFAALSASENGSVCFEYFFGQDGSEKAAHHESPLLKAFMPPNADFDDESESNAEEELETLCTDAVDVDESTTSSSSAPQRLLRENTLVVGSTVATASDTNVSADAAKKPQTAESINDTPRRGYAPIFGNQSSAIGTTSKPPHRVELFDVALLLRNIITCLNRERDWDVLSAVLADLPLLLRNHPLLIAVVARAQHTTLVSGFSANSSSPTTGTTLHQQHASLAALARQRRSVAALPNKLAQNSGGAIRAGSVSMASTTTPAALQSSGTIHQNSAYVVGSASVSAATAIAGGTSKSESDDEPPHNLVEQLASALCQLCLDRERSDPAHLHNTPASLTRSAVQERVFPALASMASCAVFIGVETQQHIIKCLEQCLDSRNARLPLRALTLCLMQFAEMRMTKLLPSVLASVMKISSSERNSTHMLEFLSNLVNLPHLYRNFVDDQFRSMFALALPYTNPYRFSNYAVALAYVTLASWFLRSRVLFRKEFVRFIVKGLKSNLLMSDNARTILSRQSQALALEAASTEGAVGKQLSAGVNTAGRKESIVGIPQSSGDDSPLRRRTLSVNAAQYQRMKAAAAAQAAAGQDPHASTSSITSALQRQSSNNGGCESSHGTGTTKYERGLLYELIETFVDLMERHAFGNVVPQPPKSATPLDVFSPERLQSKTWLLGYRMIRITTLGPGNVSASMDPTSTITAASGRALSKQAFGNAGNHGSLASPLFSARGRTLEAAFAHGAIAATSEVQQSVSQRRATTVGVLSGTMMDASILNERGLSIVPSSPAGNSIKSDVSSLTNDSVVHHGLLLGDDAVVSSPFVANGNGVAVGSDTNKSLSPVEQQFFYADLDSQYSEHSRSSSKSRIILEEGEGEDTMAYDANSPGVMTTGLRTSCSDSALAVTAASGNGNYSGGAADGISLGFGKANDSEDKLSLNDAGIGVGDAVARREQPFHQRHRHPTSPPTQQHSLPPAWLLVQQQRQLNAAATLLSSSSWVLIHVGTATGVTQWTMKMDNFMLFSLPSLLSAKQDVIIGSDSTLPATDVSSAGGGYPSLAWPLSGTHVGTADGMYNVHGGGSTDYGLNDSGGGTGGVAGHYIDPAFVFLHLFCTHLTGERPLLLPKTDGVERAVKVLDRIHPYETHKIGVMYCGPHQRSTDEIAMLSNTSGSLRYMNFLAGLGELVSLASIDPDVTYTGGLDCSASAEDGRYTYVWRTFLTQLVFHVTTLMPNRESDPKFTGKMLHIGNDFVNIVYNESKTGEEFRIQTLKASQFVMACVVIHPLPLGINSVRVLVRDDLRDVLPQWQTAPAVANASAAAVPIYQTGYYAQEDIVTDRFLASFVRQTAMHLNLACRIFKEERKSAPSMGGNEYPFVSNWFERLRQLKRIRHRLTQDENVVVAGGGSKSTAAFAGSSDSGAASTSSIAAGKNVQYVSQNSNSSASASSGSDVRRRYDSYSEVDIDFTDFL